MTPFIFGKRGRPSVARAGQNHYLEKMCSGLSPRSVINLGATPDAPDKEGRRYQDYFPKAEMFALDQRPHEDPRYVMGDLMQPTDHLGPYDLVLLMSVIEHIDRPWVAAQNIADLIAPGGHLYVAVPWLYPTHEGPDFGDHWRMRPSALRILFDMLEPIEEAYYPSSIIAVADRRRYWKDADSIASGVSMLFRKPS